MRTVVLRNPSLCLCLCLGLCLGLCACGKSRVQSGRTGSETIKPNTTTTRDRPVELSARTLDPRTQGLKSWRDLIPAVEESRRAVKSKDKNAVALDRPGLTLTWGAIQYTLDRLRETLPELDANPGLLDARFTWYKLAPDTLLTGYYEPWIEVQEKPDSRYKHAIYGLPPSAKSGAPLPDRDAVDHKGALKGQGLELVYAKNLVDVFFLHVQGSGRVVFPDGRVKHILYAGSNNRPYTPVGRVLIDKGYATREEMSMQTIRRVLAERPAEVRTLLAHNEKYIFFRLADDGPYGASGAKLTPYVAGAVDKTYIPFGGVLAITAELPSKGTETNPFAGLVLAQDTGVMKDNHIDLFTGSGDLAAHQAGLMKSSARAAALLIAR